MYEVEVWMVHGQYWYPVVGRTLDRNMASKIAMRMEYQYGRIARVVKVEG